MRNILELILLRLKRFDLLALSAEVRRGGQGVFTLKRAIESHPHRGGIYFDLKEFEKK